MARADTHEQSKAAAERARDSLLEVARDKAAASVDRQVDRFAETAARAKRDWKSASANDAE